MATGAPLAPVLRAAAPVWVRVSRGQSLDEALRCESAGESGATASALRAICHDALRHRALIEAVLARLAGRPPQPRLAGLLAAALSQLLEAAYPDHVVVDQAVTAARGERGLRDAAGFVNALLRNFVRQRDALLPDLLRDEAIRFNVPRWWLEAVRRDWPQQWQDILDSASRPGPLVLRINRRRCSVADYLARLARAGIEATRVGEWAVRLHRAQPVDKVPGFSEGWVSVQDAGAQLAAPWLQPTDAMRVLDACAAPGGKTCHLAELSDARIDAVEVDPARADKIQSNLARLGFDTGRVRVLRADARDVTSFWDGAAYDRILLDAPCTGSGIVRRHPDIPWLRRPTDVAQLTTVQAALLDALWPLLAPTGRLLYVVCSVFREEADRQADSFAARHADARPIALAGVPHSSVQLLPRTDGVAPNAVDGLPSEHDGFFFALFEKAHRGG